jgi:hypothetical protein
MIRLLNLINCCKTDYVPDEILQSVQIIYLKKQL